MTARYLALGSSMAAGPGILPRVKGSPRLAGRSTRNYPHLVADRLGYSLVDVTYSGATTANLLAEPQHGTPRQLAALNGTEALVTVTIGGNDIGYVPYLAAAALPRIVHRIPMVGRAVRDVLDTRNHGDALTAVRQSLVAVGAAIRDGAPDARVFFVDYLTLLSPPGVPAPPLTPAQADTGRAMASALADVTADAAHATGCELIRASTASQDHHPWSVAPWTTRPGLPLPRRPAPLHPNAAGMRAVADLIVAALDGNRPAPAP